MTISVRIHDLRYACDYWLASRRKCRRYGSVEARDRYGAPLRFCTWHWNEISSDRGRGSHYGPLTRWSPS